MPDVRAFRYIKAVKLLAIKYMQDYSPNTEFFWSVFSRTPTEYGDLLRNTDQKKLRTWKLFTQC